MTLRDSRVLVTGASGFIGGHLAGRLLAEGARVRVLVRDPSRLPEALAGQVELCVGDLDARDALGSAVTDVNYVFHCAANVHTWDRVEAYDSANVTGVANLLDAIAASGTLPERFVHVSTVDVYGFPPRPCGEDDPPNPPGFGYGDSKLHGEALLRERAQTLGMAYTVLRPTNVMGPGSPFIARIGEELRAGLMLQVDGGQVDCGFLAVDNLVDCLLWAAEAPVAAGEIYNVRDPEHVTWRMFLQDFRKGIGGKGLVVGLPYWLACAAARVLAAPYRMLGLSQEPLLHPLIVQIFGRTCGHRIDKLQAAGAPLGRQSYRDTLQASIDWFQRHGRS
ncbi:hypothetical protein BJI67_10615 [Acidihalobacter aeolianus]|uniref:NAD-dependent epimerase/dehydratase domain-containing protein n=1 Tax=Acidihalobacter aeolianus TaxID=2792603 RepID=A0A1D8K8Z9_9GAMM|nr:NAD(P)-dependent oxidoreductase [Acidihalobacter aeolianus]AOV17449.1 hypothetical protein BJI67_10615 [Acidihalobacter aeolianus]